MTKTEEELRERFIREFTQLILHGDAAHQQWLLDAAEQFIKDGTVPPPRDKKDGDKAIHFMGYTREKY